MDDLELSVEEPQPITCVGMWVGLEGTVLMPAPVDGEKRDNRKVDVKLSSAPASAGAFGRHGAHPMAKTKIKTN